MTFFLWAHRGASARAPENTLAAFRAAEEDGADGIELDVQLTRDGTPVVLHDETLDRTTDGHGPVARMPLRDVLRLDAGGWFSSVFAAEPVPTLEEVLEWAGTRLRVNIEIKSEKAAGEVLALLRDFPQSRVLISSFHPRALRFFRAAAPSLPLGVLTAASLWHRSLAFAAACGAESFHPHASVVSSPLVASCHRKRMSVLPWGLGAGGDLARMFRLGADGVFVDDPAAARARRFRHFRNP